MSRRLRRSLGWAVAAVASLGGGYLAWSQRGPIAASLSPTVSASAAASPPPGGAAVPVEVTRPRAGGIERVCVQPGTVEPFEMADFYAKASGFLAEQSVDIGSWVLAGDVLARLSVPESERQVGRDKARGRNAQAKVRQVEASIQAAEADARAADAAAGLSRVAVKAKSVYRQQGASTLGVAGNLKADLPDMKDRLTTPHADLKLVMDPSVYVESAIRSLTEEGVLGAILCSLLILLLLGEWRMTLIAVLTIPVAILAAVACLSAAGQSINVMALAGFALAIGPLVDLAIVVLENTHRHLGLGAKPREAAYLGASEVALPSLAATFCTLLVPLALALIPGLGAFVFLPPFLAVAFAVLIADFVSSTLAPARCAGWLRGHAAAGHESHAADRHATDPEFQRLLTETYGQRLVRKGWPAGALPLDRANAEFAFDPGGAIRSAMNEGKSTPINVRVTAKNLTNRPSPWRWAWRAPTSATSPTT